MTQLNRLKQHFLLHGSVDALTSWQYIGIYRLSARVLELRQQGWDIKTERKEVKNQFGETCLVANYVYHQNPFTSL